MIPKKIRAFCIGQFSGTNAKMINTGPTIRSTYWCRTIGITLMTPAGKSVRSVMSK